MRHSGPFLVAVAATVGAIALGGCPKPKPKPPGCAANTDCKDGQVCVAQACVACTEDAQCGDGQVCEAGACAAKPECTKDAECGDGQVCKAGACTACASNGECGPGGTCTAGVCKRPTACTTGEECADDEDCLDGYCQKPWDPPPDPTACALQTVYFGFDKAAIEQSERDRLDANASCIEKTPGRSVYVEGHTDASGTDEYNIALSERRARAAADYLARLGIDPAVLDIVPKGETETTGGTDEQDRRVDFEFR
jgi:peptidoglycan-associated lipoprotein